MSPAVTHNMDDRRKAGGYLLPYQTRWVYDTGRFVMGEKSIRIGITFAQEFLAVRERLIPGMGDYLHSSVTQGVANQFIQECEFWIDLYRKGGAVLARDTMEYVDEEVDPRTQEIIRVRKKAFSLKFDTGQRIVSFSSSPSAIRGFGGNVGLDEIAFHGNMAEMMKAAGGRAMWGYGVRLWSSHNGVGSDFNAKLEEERAKGEESRWSIHRITLLDAIEDGLVEKINSTRGLAMTRDEFIAQTKELCGSIAAFEEECMCNPRERGLPLVSWHDLTWARKEYEITRVHVEGDAGMNDMMDPAAVRLIGERLWQLLDGDSRYCLGYDVARTGHLSAIPLLRREGPGRYRLVMLITMHNCKFASQREFIVDLMSHARNIVGAGDSTGAGMQVCEELQDRFGARFSGINFGTYKPELGTVLQRTCEDHSLLLPAGHEHEDIVHDIHGIKVDPGATRMRFTESKNPGNALSHCDIAWGIALALFADDGDTGDVMGEVSAMAATGAALSGHADRAGWHRPDNSDDFVRTTEENW